MKRIISALALILALAASAEALTIPVEEISGSRRSGIYAWRYAFDLSVIDDIIRVDVDLAFTGAMSDPLWSRWETGIESTWSTDRFDVPILFNVDRVSSGYDYLVNVVPGSGRANMLQWYTTSNTRTAAHEFGHQISLFDEYVGGATDPDNPIISYDGVMGYGYLALDRYYSDILGWYEDKLEMYGGGNDPAPVPEPGTVALMVVGMAAVILFKRKQIV